mgnify:CR=1 FL=1
MYVNRSLASNPINLGVATFDGLDSLGNPRNIFSEFSQGPSDFLTSQTIDISSESIVYFSFYFQAQGIGNQPESNDILRVDFLDSIGEWNVVWEINGQDLNDFEKVTIHYYKALNYIFLNKLDEALVEAKRINLQLQQLNDKYPAGQKNRYTSDGFSLNIQGFL